MSRHDAEMIWIGPGETVSGLSPEIAGSKAVGIWRMVRAGLRVPPAFVLPAGLCATVNAHPDRAAREIAAALRAGVERLEAATGRRFGDSRAPLLVSVRSGAAVSMPGMLSTVLNVGLGPKAVRGLIRLTGDPRFAWDSYRRFIESYATVVVGAPSSVFERRLAEMVAAEGAADESELDGEALERLSADFAEIAARHGRGPLSEEPIDQLSQAVLAVYRSWEGRRAREYRRMKQLDGLAGTAVTVQAMVFGNADRRSGSGVAFSRNPATGEKTLYVDFLFGAQGEDVVSGRRTPVDAARLGARLPSALSELQRGASLLETERRDVQDIEFTIQDGELYFLQTRNAQRTPRAALVTLVDLVREGVLDPATALERLAGIDLERVGITRFADGPEQGDEPVARAISASPGVASGRVAFDRERARAMAAAGDPVILVRHEPSTDDVDGFAAACGILTAVGGRTAHAAVVARQLDRVCLVGCAGLSVDPAAGRATLGGHPLRTGDWISLDGESGEVSVGRRRISTFLPEAEFAEVERWRRLGQQQAS